MSFFCYLCHCCNPVSWAVQQPHLCAYKESIMAVQSGIGPTPQSAPVQNIESKVLLWCWSLMSRLSLKKIWCHAWLLCKMQARFCFFLRHKSCCAAAALACSYLTGVWERIIKLIQHPESERVKAEAAADPYSMDRLSCWCRCGCECWTAPPSASTLCSLPASPRDPPRASTAMVSPDMLANSKVNVP